MTLGDMPPRFEAEGEEPMLAPPSRGKMRNLDIGGGSVKTAAISFVVTFVVLMLMTVAGGVSFVTKQDFAVNMANVATTLEQAKADVAKAKSEIASAVLGIPGTTQTYANNAVVQSTSQWNSQLSAVSDRVTGLQTEMNKVADLTVKVSILETQAADSEARIKALETKVSDYETRIKALEAKLVTPTPPSSVITAKLTKQSDSLVPVSVASGNVTSLAASVKLVLTNPTALDVDDIIITLFVGTEAIPNVSSVVITSSPALSWVSSGWFSYTDMEFRNGWGLSVLASKSKTIYLTITVQGNALANYTRSYGYGIEAEVSD